MKGICISQSKKIKFERYYNCLFGSDYQKKCDNYSIKSNNHEMFLQKVCESRLSAFDEKRCYTNEIESITWNYYW